MIAIMNQQGAYLYNCSLSEATRRIKVSVESERKYRNRDFSFSHKGDLDYDEHGNMRTEDGMCGWLFMSKNLMTYVKNLQCEAVIIYFGDTYKIYTSNDYENLEVAFVYAYLTRTIASKK